MLVDSLRHSRQILSVWLVFASAAVSAAPVADVPYETRGHYVTVPIAFDGGAPLACIFDTGMPSGLFVFDPALGERLGLEYAGAASVTGSGGGAREARVALGARIVLAGVEFPDQRVIVLGERHQLADAGVDAVIGQSVLDRFVVEIDPEAKRLRLHDPAGFQPPPGAEQLALTFKDGKPYVPARVAIKDGEAVPVTLLLDTGAAGTLSLEPSSVEALSPPEKTIETIVAGGIAADVYGRRGRIRSLHLGDSVLRHVVADFPTSPSDRVNGSDGQMGLGVLGRFRLLLDYPGKRALLLPTKALAAPFETNMAGVVLRPAAGGLRIHHVVEGSSAAAAGLRAGDRLIAIDGESIPPGLAEVDRAFERDGEKVRLTVERDGEKFEATLRLSRMI